MKYIAELPHVREVSLSGAADLAWWAAHLERDGVRPVDHDGQARLLISAPDSKFRGVPFCEFVVAVDAVRETGPEREPGYALVGAFNSSRMLACMERTFFSTPYHHNAVRNDVSSPCIEVVEEGGPVFRAAMTPDADRRPEREGEEWWTGPIFLPGDRRKPSRTQKWFAAKIGGFSRAWTFAPSDTLIIQSSRRHPMLGWLVESRFVPGEWIVRPDALHARTKTFKRRVEVPPSEPVRTQSR